MARRRLGKGDLGAVTIINESSYGVPVLDVDNALNGGKARKFKVTDGASWEEESEPSSRARGRMILKGRDVVATLTVAVFSDIELGNWLKWATGSTTTDTGNAAYIEPSSRGLIVNVTLDEVEYLTGCTINKLTVSPAKIGDILLLDMEIYARSHEVRSSAGLIVLGPLGANPLRIMDYWHSADYPAGGLLNAGQWTLTVNQNLEKVPGIEGGVTSESGQEPYCGALDVNLSVTVPATVSSLYVPRNTGDYLDNLTVTIGGYVLTFYLPVLQGDGPERTTNTYEDVLEFSGSGLKYQRASQ